MNYELLAQAQFLSAVLVFLGKTLIRTKTEPQLWAARIDANYGKLEEFRGQRVVRSETALRARLKSGQKRAEGTSYLHCLLSLYIITKGIEQFRQA